MSSTVVYDPSGVVTGGLSLDRGPHLALAAAVLAWGPAPAGVRAADCALIGLQRTHSAWPPTSVTGARPCRRTANCAR